LIKEGTALPEKLAFESESFGAGWTLIKSMDGDGLGGKIYDAEWTFFCKSGGVKATRFGFDRQKTERRVVGRLLANAKSGMFNSLEINKVISRHFFGVTCATVFGHSRHIQKSLFLFRNDAA
jgi:hypothetical protein